MYISKNVVGEGGGGGGSELLFVYEFIYIVHFCVTKWVGVEVGERGIKFILIPNLERSYK